MITRLAALVMTLALAIAPVGAQGGEPSHPVLGPKGEHLVGQGAQSVDIITPHITDSKTWELPFGYEVHFKPHIVTIGGVAVDLGLSKHVVMLMIAAGLCLVVMLLAASSHADFSKKEGRPRGLGTAMEAVILYLRNEVILPNVGPHGEKFVPYLLTVFFFILFANLLGLLPYGSTATGNISVTAMMAIISFLVIEIAGIRAQGWGYVKTIVYIPPPDMPWWLKPLMIAIMTPVEILSKFTKPFALAIRLFANMTAGHVVLLAFISLIFTFGSYFVAVVPVGMGVALSLLEIFVGFLQAFIFTILTAVFIGLIRAGAH